jgi:starvation-inducible DNA-binding protein
MIPHIGLTDTDRGAVSKLLQHLLADEVVLYTKTRNAHWNVTGPTFAQLHAFFEEQYDQLAEIIDNVAERIRMLGGHAAGSLAEYLRLTRLQEHPERCFTTQEHLSQLLADHETIIRQLRLDLEIAVTSHHDAGTSDFLTGLLGDHEKMAWMLRASIGV